MGRSDRCGRALVKAVGASQRGEKDEEDALRYDETHETQPAICEMINSEM